MRAKLLLTQHFLMSIASNRTNPRAHPEQMEGKSTLLRKDWNIAFSLPYFIFQKHPSQTFLPKVSFQKAKMDSKSDRGNIWPKIQRTFSLFVLEISTPTCNVICNDIAQFQWPIWGIYWYSPCYMASENTHSRLSYFNRICGWLDREKISFFQKQLIFIFVFKSNTEP